MSAGKHTPGPWEVSDEHPTRAAIRIVHGYHEVAALYGPHAGTEKDENGVYRGDHERVANARLIAASPRMYDALRQIAAEDHPDGFFARIAKKALEGL